MAASRHSFLIRADRRLAQAETLAATLLTGAALLAISAGTLGRNLGQPLLWADEFAVLAMAAAAFVGASALIATGGHISVDLLDSALPHGRLRRATALLREAAGCAVIGVLALLVARWFDPVGLVRAGSDAALAQDTLNFIYQSPTMTLGMGKHWFWLALPVFATGALLHAALRLWLALRGGLTGARC